MKKAIIILSLFIVAIAVAQVPEYISFQGRLSDIGGNVMPDDEYTLRFRLYTTSTGGSHIWDEFQELSTSGGLFSAMLGTVTAFGAGVDFSNHLWLSVQVVGHGDELSPRYQLGSSPSAFYAKNADQARTASTAEEAHRALLADEAEIARSVAWEDIEGIPPGLGESIEYSAGAGITITDYEISIADAGVTANMLHQMGASEGQVLKWNGTAWAPAADIGGDSGDDWGSQVVESNATLDGNGTSANPLTIAQQGAVAGQVLKWNGATWAPAADIGGDSGDDWGDQVVISTMPLFGDGTVASPLRIVPGAEEGQVLKTVGGSVIWADETGGAAGDDWGDQVVISDASLTGDGTALDPLGIANSAITSDMLSDMGADIGQVLKWNGVAWVPAADIGGDAGDDWGSQVVETDATLRGNGLATDRLGLAIAAVTRVHIADNAINGNKIDDMGADIGQVLKWTGATWAPADDEVGAGGGEGDDWGDQVVISDASLTGDGTALDPLGIADGAITTAMLSDMGAADGQVLKWNDATSSWQPAADIGGDSGDDWGAQVVESDATLAGDGTLADPLTIAQQGALPGQVLKWDGASWTPANDETGAGGAGNWTLDPITGILRTNGQYGIFRDGSIGIGTHCSTHVNFGVESTTGLAGFDLSYIVISGGINNIASNNYSTIGGGRQNNASGSYASIAGGRGNEASDTSATIGGGGSNMASGVFSVVSGGLDNTALSPFSTIGGGKNNSSRSYSTVSGGEDNNASGSYSVVSGGQENQATGLWSFAGGGYINLSSGRASTIGGGFRNEVNDEYATVGGGRQNEANGEYTTIGGGSYNIASGHRTTISGGSNNTTSGTRTTVGGGSNNSASRWHTTIGGGSGNEANGTYSTIAGGKENIASGDQSIVAGGLQNEASDTSTTVGGGSLNIASGKYSVVGGGLENEAIGIYSGVLGGYKNTADGNYSYTFGQLASNNGNHNTVVFRWATTPGTVFINMNVLSSGYGVYMPNTGGRGDGIARDWATHSDESLKRDIVPIDNSLNIIQRLRPVNYNWLSDGTKGIGFIAQEVQQVLPELVRVSDNETGQLGVSYLGIVPVNTAAIQEQQKQIEELRAEIELLRQEIQNLKQK